LVIFVNLKAYIYNRYMNFIQKNVSVEILGIKFSIRYKRFNSYIFVN